MIPVKNLVFFNHFHNGDLHVSRTLVSKFIEKIKPETAYYSHSCNSEILKDISVSYLPDFIKTTHELTPYKWSEDNQTLYLNTWYRAAEKFGTASHGVSYDSLYFLFEGFAKLLGFSLTDISSNPGDFLPSIDFSVYDIGKVDQWTANHPQKKIFICNSAVLSDQSPHYDMIPLFRLLTKKYPDIILILTEDIPSHLKTSNMFSSRDIIGRGGFDLNETAYLSTKCDMIVGRPTGPFSFAFNQTNLFEKGQPIIALSNLSYPGQFWLNDLNSSIKYKSPTVNYDGRSVEDICRIIAEFKI